MMRLPLFEYRSPGSVAEAAAVLADHPPGEAMLLGGGTDLVPNMKRRQQTPRLVVALRGIAALRGMDRGAGLRLGSGMTLTELVRDEGIRRHYTGLWQAAAQVATPPLRNVATLGGNLCLDTRCNYYDQNYEWRKSIDFCMKKDGAVCWVATSSPRCLAVSSTDTAPALVALGARVRLVSAAGERVVPLRDLYRDDGIRYLATAPGEILTDVILDPDGALRSTYWKLRRRGAFDFPVLSVGAAARFGAGGVVEEARIVLGAIASRPVLCEAAAAAIAGAPLTDETIAGAAEAAWQLARPMDNTDLVYHWRKRATRAFVTYALRELRGEDMREIRRATAGKDFDGLP